MPRRRGKDSHTLGSVAAADKEFVVVAEEAPFSSFVVSICFVILWERALVRREVDQPGSTKE